MQPIQYTGRKDPICWNLWSTVFCLYACHFLAYVANVAAITGPRRTSFIIKHIQDAPIVSITNLVFGTRETLVFFISRMMGDLVNVMLFLMSRFFCLSYFSYKSCLFRAYHVLCKWHVSLSVLCLFSFECHDAFKSYVMFPFKQLRFSN